MYNDSEFLHVPTDQARKRRLEVNTNADPLAYLWSGLLTLVTGGILYAKTKDDRKLEAELKAIWDQKADRDVVELVLIELRDSRKERRDDFQALSSRLDEILHRSHSIRKEDQ